MKYQSCIKVAIAKLLSGVLRVEYQSGCQRLDLPFFLHLLPDTLFIRTNSGSFLCHAVTLFHYTTEWTNAVKHLKDVTRNVKHSECPRLLWLIMISPIRQRWSVVCNANVNTNQGVWASNFDDKGVRWAGICLLGFFTHFWEDFIGALPILPWDRIKNDVKVLSCSVLNYLIWNS